MKLAVIMVLVALTVGTAGVTATEPRERSDIADEYKWDLSAMYSSAGAWDADAARFEAMLPDLAQYRGRLGEGGETLLAAIVSLETVESLIGNLYVYAGLSAYEDTRVSANTARFSRAQSLYARYEEATAFFRPELLTIDGERLQSMIDGTQGLAIYRHFIDEQLRLRDYTLSESEEKLLAAAGEPLGKFSDIFSAFNDADIRYPEIPDGQGNQVELTKASYSAFLNGPDRAVREAAWTAMYNEYAKMGNLLAAIYEAHVKARVFEAKVRGFESALDAATYRSAIPSEVYTNLVRVTRDNPAPLKRYMSLRREALGLETQEVWDTYAPIAESVIQDVPWEDAKKIVADALTPLGPDYVDVYWLGFKDGWVDVFESRGKRSGAYSWGTYTSKPYLSMNYNGTFESVTILAHEYGHSIHSYLARSSQPYAYGGYRTFIAEIASMTNEAILFQKMLAEATSRDEKIFLLQSYLDQFRGSFYQQASFADFELQAYTAVEAGKALTRDSLNDMYSDTFAAYYGDSVVAHPLVASTWSRIPHFFGNNYFYVYQYATSFAAATALAKMILEEGEPARLRYLEMLKSGSNDYPINLLKKAGIDMTTPAPIKDTIAVFENYLDQLDALIQAQ